MDIERQAARSRPPGRPIMHQTWDRLLFMHWPVTEELLRPLVPGGLQIDTYDGTAWVGVTPFTMPSVRPRGLPALPLVCSSHEINVRTYVHRDGVPGVWFLSLDASNPLAVLGARIGFGLPYFLAQMTLDARDETIRFTSRRRHPGAPGARLDVTWQGGAGIPDAQPGTLDFFLIERYCLYAARRSGLYRTRIHHRPWPLRRAELWSLTSTMFEAHGLPAPGGMPLLHAQAAPLHVDVWLPSQVGTV